MKNNATTIRIFSIIGITATIIGYLFLLYKGYTLNNDIDNLNKNISEKVSQKNKLEKEIQQLFDSKVNAEKELKIATDGIKKISQHPDKTVEISKKLVKELGIPDTNFIITNKKNANKKNAEIFQNEGFDSIINKDVNAAISSFIKSENSMNGFNQVFEIARYLKKNKDNLSDQNSPAWKETYKIFVTKFSYGMPERYKAKFKQLSN